jgi:hypothetical protein
VLLAALALALKASLTAAVVVGATVIAERSRPMLAAAVMALPVSAGPAYVLLAFQHDAAFLADSSLVGLMLNVSTTALVVGYAALARRGVGLGPALAGGYAGWLATLVGTMAVPSWSLAGVVAVQLVGMLAGIFVTRSWRGPPVRSTIRKWYDLPLRALLVVTLTLSTVVLSALIGPVATGVLAAMPVTFTSFIIVMHLRVGGPATANMMASALTMLPGFAAGLLGFHLCAAAGQIPLGLVVFFVVPVVYAVALLSSLARSRRRTA